MEIIINYKIIKRDKIKYILKTENDGVHFIKKCNGEEIENVSNIMNFYFKLINCDISKNIITYSFKFYKLIGKKYILSDDIFYYDMSKRFTELNLQKQLPKGCAFKNSYLKYIKMYIDKLITTNICEITQNKRNIDIMEKFVISFMNLIDGKENIYLENDFVETDKYIRSNEINSNQDLFIRERNKNSDYKKVGFVKEEYRKKWYYMHTQSLIELVKDKEKNDENKVLFGKITSHIFYTGLDGLNILSKTTAHKPDNNHNLKSKLADERYYSIRVCKLDVNRMKEISGYNSDMLENEKEQEENNYLTVKTGAGFEVSCGVVAVENKDNIMPQYPQYSNYQEPQQSETRQARKVVTFDKTKCPVRFLDEE